MAVYLALIALMCIELVSADRLSFAILADKGESCREACATRQSICDIDDWTQDDVLKHFKNLNLKCEYDERSWWLFDQPAVVVDPLDDNFGRCLGWKNKPEIFDCSARWPTARRLCQCAFEKECPRFV